MIAVTQADMDTLAEAEVSEAAALSLRAQAEGFEREALALRQGVYAGWVAPPVVTPPIPPVIEPPIVIVPPVDPPAPPVYDTLPALKSGASGAWQVYDFTGKRFAQQLNLRRLSYVHVIGGTYEYDGNAFYVDAGSDIEVECATFTGPPASSINVQRCRIINSTRVYLRGCTVIGGLATTGIPIDQLPPLDSTGNVIGLGTGEGVYFSNCDDCGIEACDVSLLHQGVALSNSLVHLFDNKLHGIRTTAVAGTPRSNSTFLRNIATNITPWQYGGSGDHGDNPFHFWTVGAAIDGLIINDNEYRQGAGAPTLGIFLQDKNGKFTPRAAC